MQTNVRGINQQPLPPKPSGMSNDEYNLLVGSLTNKPILVQAGANLVNSTGLGGVSASIAEISTKINDGKFWLDVGFILVGIALVIISANFIMQGEISGYASKIVSGGGKKKR